jgi:hypothetical protein
MEWVVFWLGLAIAVRVIASSKGRKEAVSLVERELWGNPNSHGTLRGGAASAAYA